MRSSSLAFLLGISLILIFKQLPSYLILLVLLITNILLFFINYKFFNLKIIKLFCIFLLGFIWVIFLAQYRLNIKLPDNFNNKSNILTGTIVSIPENKNNVTEFLFLPDNLSILIRLNWYYPQQTLHIGEHWQLSVKLKNPRGYWNPGAFDYQQWLFEQNIRAVGYVETNKINLLLNKKNNFILDKQRQNIADHINSGLIAALAVGMRDKITPDQWQVLRGTGTNHLFAIAGLHIGLVTAFIYFITNYLWRRAGRLPLYLPTPHAAVIGSLIFALIYSALAGFSLPTQRALIMISVFLISSLIKKNIISWTPWCLALWVVLILEPLAVLSPSFWLSFGAVALIIYGVDARINLKGLWWHWGRIQWVLAVGLTPLCLLFFQQTSILGFIANAIAIPWVGFIVLPLTLLGDACWFLFLTKIANFCWLAADKCLGWLWPVLDFLAHIEVLQWHLYINNLLIFFSLVIAILLLLLPKGMYGRWLGIIWLIPVVFWKPAGPKFNEVWFSLLDVGQGLASVVQTQNHVLIYSTTSKSNIILSYLKYLNINKIDLQINPNSGCIQNQQWNWDGVQFQILNNSCMLKININNSSILLTNNKINNIENNLLPSSILIAPHYGSKSISNLEFVNKVHPEYVLFSTGINNRFGFPDPEVLADYKNIKSKIYNTAQVGYIIFKITGQGSINLPKTYEIHFWDY